MAIKQLSRDNFGISQARFVLRGTAFPLATGGTETVINPEPNVFYRVHSFTDVGESSLEVLTGGEFEYLVVGGGGGGGSRSGAGGGGAGELKKFVAGEAGNTASTPVVLTTGVVSAFVAAGGLGAEKDVAALPGENGGDTQFGSLVSIGGGGGGASTGNGLEGASGGGGGRDAGETLGGAGFAGNPGGNGATGGFNSGACGGGGGGAGGPGGNGGINVFGARGDGVLSAINGLSTLYAQGGGGARTASSGSNGGLGGCNETPRLLRDGLPGGTNTGGGGGGGGNTSSGGIGDLGVGGNGGSGIVIVRYRISQADFLASGGVIA